MSLLLLPLLVLHCAGQPTVDLPQGRLQGFLQQISSGRHVSSFLGIPYARPPIGNLRFQAPVPADSWRGSLNATHMPPDCLQYSHLTYHFPYCPVNGAEDCLYLNVFTPLRFDGSDGGKRMPVLVYIHPGTWMYFGSSYLGPEALLERDIVLVTFNYRLGPLGFLSTGDSVVPGNNGLKDQVLALKWVQANIHAFGGDPDKVTLAGLTAGAASVHYHLLSPASKGLFQRGISASGTALCPWALAERVPEKSAEIAALLGCPTSPSSSMVACLRDRPGHHIVGLSAHFMPWLYYPYAPFGPVVEPADSRDAFITGPPQELIRSGKTNQLPWLLSFVTDEGLYPAAEILGTAELIREVEERWDELVPLLLDYNSTWAGGLAQAARAHYRADLTTEEGKRNFIKMVGDRLYMNGISEAVKLHTQEGSAPVYLYQFDYKSKNTVADMLTKFRLKERYGVCHGDDMLHIFPTPWFQDTDQAIASTLVDIWAKFAASGEADWDSVGANELVYRVVRGPGDFRTATAGSLGDLDFWSGKSLKDEL